jgi:hypothetical protein
LKDFALHAATKGGQQNQRFAPKKIAGLKFPRHISSVATEKHSSTNRYPIDLNKAGFITEKPKGSVALGIINTIYKGNLEQSVHCYGSSGLCGVDDSEASNVLSASLTLKFFSWFQMKDL